MDVAVTELRAHLREYLDRAHNGETVVITDRGMPIARLTALDHEDLIEKLTREGVLGRPKTTAKIVASGRPRPRPKRPVSDYVSEGRR
jgi:prevent-host-death family protein